jgi:hypothetical protein
MMADSPSHAELVFVYNADSGLFNSVADAAHKILSPSTYSCNLCKVTYGWFTERTQWRSFVESLNVPCSFIHRDELRRRHPELGSEPLPAVFQVVAGQAARCADAETLNACTDLDSLIALIREHCCSASGADSA